MLRWLLQGRQLLLSKTMGAKPLHSRPPTMKETLSVKTRPRIISHFNNGKLEQNPFPQPFMPFHEKEPFTGTEGLGLVPTRFEKKASVCDLSALSPCMNKLHLIVNLQGRGAGGHYFMKPEQKSVAGSLRKGQIGLMCAFYVYMYVVSATLLNTFPIGSWCLIFVYCFTHHL